MTDMQHPYPEGIDCVWLAADIRGQLGAFVTGGQGPVPSSALQTSAPDIEEIEECLLALPKSTDAKLVISLKQSDSFIALAERGLFVYDWRDAHRTQKEATKSYEQVAVPARPASIKSLSSPLAELARHTSLGDIDFANQRSIQISLEIR